MGTQNRDTMGAVLRESMISGNGMTYENALLAAYSKYKDTPQALVLSGKDQRIVASATTGADVKDSVATNTLLMSGGPAGIKAQLMEKHQARQEGTESGNKNGPSR